MIRESPLAALHDELGARMVEFAGWRMPIQYAGILAEHRAVRHEAGVFDISHMGEIFVRGEDAVRWLETMLTNEVARLDGGDGQYTLMLNTRGGVIDDLILYRTGAQEFLLVVNAALGAEDLRWLAGHREGAVDIEDRSAAFGALAVQGPRAAGVFERATRGTGAVLPPRNEVRRIATPEGEVFVCRTGYTGEDGFEWFCPAAATETWMRRMLEAGAAPCGLGARDTLRLEMGYPLNGSDLSPERTPLEAGLGAFVALEKGEFIGRAALGAQRQAGGFDRLTGIRMAARGAPPRPHYAVWAGAERIGELTSGTLSPSLGLGIGMAYLPARFQAPGTAVDVEIRGARFPGQTAKKPFLRRATG